MFHSQPMNLKIAAGGILLLMGFAGCVSTPRVPPPVVTPLPPAPPSPQFEKTFGTLTVGQQATLILQYKSMTLLIDPHLSAAECAAIFPQTDYVLLTDAQDTHFSHEAKNTARKNLKIIVSPAESAKIKAAGFKEVKSLTPGQRLILKKENDFLFVTAAAHINPDSNSEVISYMLEFDNGRNLFISGEVTHPDGLREFLYNLRDEGKVIYAGFFYHQRNLEANLLAQIIGLIQPNHAIILQSSLPGFNKSQLQKNLADELFDKPLIIAQQGEEIPF
ncbi:MAG: hypothetical protein KCHDKBKB_02350 [Elusimicrobia bacterium]|nr:hypothetical protein [Elusimicrobiota bacterium]